MNSDEIERFLRARVDTIAFIFAFVVAVASICVRLCVVLLAILD